MSIIITGIFSKSKRPRYLIMDEEPTDLYEDMRTLNALYEELMWDHNDVLEFVADYKNNRIIVRNKTLEDNGT